MSDTDFYQTNLEVLNRFYPDVVKRLEEEDPFDIPVETMMGRRGLPTMKVTLPSGKQITVNSVFDPMREAEEMLSKFDDNSCKRYLLIGFGLGYVAEAAINRDKNNSFVVVIEPSIKVFKAAMAARDLTGIFKTRRVVIGVGDDKSFLMEKMLTAMNCTDQINMNVVELSYAVHFPDYYKLARDLIGDWTQQAALNQFTILQLGEDFLYNMIANSLYSYFNPGLPQLLGKFINKPAIVVAPGPSLAKNVELLKEVYDKAVIIALDTALKPLLKRGIKPHIVMSVDPKEANYAKYKGADIPDDVILVGAMDTYPKIFSEFPGKIFSYFHNLEAMHMARDFLGDKGVLGSGGSVACDAFFLAVGMGAGPIVFLGLDLSFPDKKWYMDGSFREDEEVGKENAPSEQECLEFIWIEDIYGDKVATYPQYYTTLTWFNMQTPKIKNKVIDATEGGAKINGTEIMTFREVIDQYITEEFHPLQTILEIHGEYEPYDREDALTKIDELIQVLAELVDHGTRGMEICDQFDHFVKERRVGRLKKLIKKVGRINNHITSKYAVIGIVNLALAKPMYRMESFDDEVYSEEEHTAKHKDIVELSRWFFRDVKRICNEVKIRFERIQSAIDEGALPQDEDMDKFLTIEHDSTQYIELREKILEEDPNKDATIGQD